MIPPKTVGMWTGSPPFFDAAAISSSPSAGSLPAKSTVPCGHAVTPAPEPTGWKLRVMPWPFRFEPHCG